VTLAGTLAVMGAVGKDAAKKAEWGRTLEDTIRDLDVRKLHERKCDQILNSHTPLPTNNQYFQHIRRNSGIIMHNNSGMA
jgi:hypothetical protein